MNLITMKFGEFIFPNNPSELIVKNVNNIKETVIPFSGSRTSNLGRLKRKVSGKGYLVGENSFNEFQSLQAEFEKGKADLQLPGQDPFVAVMNSLDLTNIDSDNTIEYSFTFTEVLCQEKSRAMKALIAKGGESLWDYAYMHNILIDELVRLNPQIKDIDNLTKGERVVLE